MKYIKDAQADRQTKQNKITSAKTTEQADGLNFIIVYSVAVFCFKTFRLGLSVCMSCLVVPPSWS